MEYAEAKKGKADVEVRHTSYSSCRQLAPYSNATPHSHLRPTDACFLFMVSCQVLEDVLEVKGILDGPHAHAPAATATTSAATSAPPAQTH